MKKKKQVIEKNARGCKTVFLQKRKEKYTSLAPISDLLGQHFASTGPPGDSDAWLCLRTTALVAAGYSASQQAFHIHFRIL